MRNVVRENVQHEMSATWKSAMWKKCSVGKAVKRVKQKTGQSKGGKKSNIKKLLHGKEC